MQDATESDILGNYFVLLKYICTHTQIYMYICTYVYTHTHQLSDSNSTVTSVLPDYFPIKDHNITKVHPYIIKQECIKRKTKEEHLPTRTCKSGV